MPYAQAHIEVVDNAQYLFSYVTLVAKLEINKDGERECTCYGLYSQTTRKHISAFASENNLRYDAFKTAYEHNCVLNADTGKIFPLK